MKPLALLLAALVAAAAVFLLLDPSDAESEGVPVAEVSETPARAAASTGRRDSRAELEAPPLAPIPPADDAVADAEPIDLEAGSPETGLYGQVLTPSGNALADALVTLYRTEGRSLLDEQRIRVAEPVHTDGSGNYRLVGLAGGQDYLLVVEHGAFARAQIDGLEVEGDRLRRVPDVRLKGGVEIEGLVKGPTGKAVDGAVVQAIVLSDRRRLVRQVLTDAAGAYRLVGLEPGAYEVAISADGLETSRSSALPLLGDRARTRHDVRLAEAKVIAGIVTTPDGRPLDGARVSVRRLRGAGPSHGTARTGSDGRFSIGGLGEGEYNVSVERNGFVTRTEAAVGAPRENLRLALVPTVGVAGKVLDPAGEPLSAFFVRAWKVTPDGRPFEPIGDPRKVRSKDGSYTLDGFTPGFYRVEAFAPGLAPTLSARFEVKRLYVNGVDVRMKQGAAMTGVVVDPAGRAVEGATVRLLSNTFRAGPASEMLYDESQRLDRVRTDEEGRFRFEGLRKGVYQVEISARDRQRQYVRDLTVGAKGITEVGPFMLSEGGHLQGTVVDARNVPTNGARVSLSTADQGVVAEARAGDDGSFVFRNLAPGDYRVTASVGLAGGTSDDIFTQALRTLKGGVEVAVFEGQTRPVTLYVE